MRRPNFLFVITDQHRADHLGCYGNRILRTPHIDSLAAEGLRAESCYVASPICMPNRASIMTGRMPSVHGVRHNGIELAQEETTFVDLLRRDGYATALVGKSHLQCITDVPAQVPPDPKDRLPHEARRRAPGRYGQELETTWERDPAHDLDLPYYGFEHVDLSIMHADTQSGHWRRWLRRQTNEADRLVGPANAIPTPEFELAKCRQAWRTRVPEELYPNAWITERTIAAIRDFAAAGRPFFIQCSYPDPHHPFTPPGRYWDLYRPDDVEVPASFHLPHRNLPPHLRWLYDRRADGTAVRHTQALFACSEREAREAIALNYGTLTQIDDGIGRIVGALKSLGLHDDTVIIFTSDHGDFLGEHQLLLKGPVHYRPLIRVPLIWRDPAGPKARTTDALLQSTDIGPSVLARAGVAAFNGMHGRPLAALAQGGNGAAAPREFVLIEEEGQRRYLGFDRRVRMRSLVSARYRLSVYEGAEWGELYDLGEDPHETANLWDDAGRRTLRGELADAMVQAMIAHSETSPYPSYIA
jgi:arylsulfatase A-like enzyme